METPVLESLFNKTVGPQVCKLKKTLTQVFSCDYCEIFKVTNFEEQLLLFIQTIC